MGLKRRWFLAAAALAALLMVSAPAAADTAREITAECTFAPASKKKEFSKATDGSYRTYWNSNAGKGAMITVTVPEGEEASGAWFQWYEHPHAAAVQVLQDGEWTDVAVTAGEFLSECLILPKGIAQCRIANPKTAKKNTPIPISEIHVYSRGELPENVQRWEPPCEKAELMLLAGDNVNLGRRDRAEGPHAAALHPLAANAAAEIFRPERERHVRAQPAHTP